jgi:hypothetical protein
LSAANAADVETHEAEAVAVHKVHGSALLFIDLDFE